MSKMQIICGGFEEMSLEDLVKCPYCRIPLTNFGNDPYNNGQLLYYEICDKMIRFLYFL
jgi:hypothetical protein